MFDYINDNINSVITCFFLYIRIDCIDSIDSIGKVVLFGIEESELRATI